MINTLEYINAMGKASKAGLPAEDGGVEYVRHQLAAGNPIDSERVVPLAIDETRGVTPLRQDAFERPALAIPAEWGHLRAARLMIEAGATTHGVVWDGCEVPWEEKADWVRELLSMVPADQPVLIHPQSIAAGGDRYSLMEYRPEQGVKDGGYNTRHLLKNDRALSAPVEALAMIVRDPRAILGGNFKGCNLHAMLPVMTGAYRGHSVLDASPNFYDLGPWSVSEEEVTAFFWRHFEHPQEAAVITQPLLGKLLWRAVKGRSALVYHDEPDALVGFHQGLGTCGLAARIWRWKDYGQEAYYASLTKVDVSADTEEWRHADPIPLVQKICRTKAEARTWLDEQVAAAAKVAAKTA